ncbi:DUF3574 domain-containing protein [Chelatococcus reniformis]|uniref:DUF3574 domain-containing protein n=1 Tax=Chelatococcus reniformis TaxID=1494448 RepID=A0A916X7A4_9HYPH|nr:DUF3574 domain-containing protein [Chelatococcus reniformis]GGC50691.1 hypothetical protein GCM10010994_07300 [Chelatococcus reniformis]
MRLAVVLLALPIGACAAAPAFDTPRCPQGTRAGTVIEMVFGRNVGPAEAVGERAFARFIDDEVVPRFPGGLTVLDAAGYWTDAGRPARERSKVVVIAVPTDPPLAADADSLRAVATAYKARFRQKSVLTMTRRSCIGW